jgi:tripartite ATP-independent transporter DctM subunit
MSSIADIPQGDRPIEELPGLLGTAARWFGRTEAGVVSTALLLMAILPIAEMVARAFDTAVPGAQPVVQHLTLWVGFLGAALAASEGKLLALATGTLMKGRWGEAARVFQTTVSVAVSTLLMFATVEFLKFEREGGSTMALGIPVWVAMLAMPVAFALIGLRLLWKAGHGFGRGAWISRAIALLGLVGGVYLARSPEVLEFRSALPGLIVILLATVLGGPIFAALGGAAVLLFMSEAVPIAAVPVETYRLSVSPTLPAIPLFTLTGFLLAESKASERLIAVFRASVGWIPGGTAVMTAVVCAFFTVFTGGSGVTILALGGLLLPMLLADRYRENFSLGLLTASGSLGLLLPPALPLILYGIVAEVPIKDLFIGGIVPGLLLIGLLAAWGVREAKVTGAGRTPFDAGELKRSFFRAFFELLLPVFLLVPFFNGWATLVELAALSVLYSLVLFVVRSRGDDEISIRGDLPRVLRDCGVLVGGVLIILGVAMGLTNYMVDAMIPSQMLDWVQGHIDSPLVFLLTLNVFLLIVGCLMDIFSATVVVVPLIVPLGAAYGINPIHLGIIFIANLELGYLTPPVGLNLFLASYRFEKPLLKIYKAAVPMLIILGIGVLLITYVPELTTGIFKLLGREPGVF